MILATPHPEGTPAARFVRDLQRCCPTSQIILVDEELDWRTQLALAHLGVVFLPWKHVKCSGVWLTIMSAQEADLVASSRAAVEQLSAVLPEGTMLAEGPTPREATVLQMVAAGLANKAIARRLRIRERTVRFHLENLFRKLDATSRTDMLHRARQRGWLR
jgi:DNA-binding NarL/FixJ family response regulator